jgi:soluble lytic murein transglycosylase-like protein
MILRTAKRYDIDPSLIMAIAQVDSHFGVTGKGARTKNPGN